ncbi:hypothetical protein FRX31_006667 [Thalictrum thalictroides]|uniref:DUF4283 domain-containing protein n=1 Tax=Thalictrum thalictroides TaxID=46969 RepID=A0A7J6X1Y9_THATH|nr:hypothetical protein FRX31_006667 [Thalictrum thalictroides]
METISTDLSVPGKMMEKVIAPMSWSSHFHVGSSSKLKTTLTHFTLVLDDGIAKVPEEIVERRQKEWEDYLVGSFVGKRLHYPLVKTALQKRWGTHAFEMVADEKVFYFKFHSEQDKMIVIEKGPTLIAGRLFMVKFWTPEAEKGKPIYSMVMRRLTPTSAKQVNVGPSTTSNSSNGFSCLQNEDEEVNDITSSIEAEVLSASENTKGNQQEQEIVNDEELNVKVNEEEQVQEKRRVRRLLEL